MLGSSEDAGDVTQDVLIRLWRQRDNVDEEKILPWLMRVTRNACIDVIRHRRTVRSVVDDGADVAGLPHEEDSPAAELERRDDRQMIEDALAQIGEPYRSVVILREIQNLKYEEISGAMDMPLNTVKVYLHRGRKMLREKLTEVMDRERV